MHNPFLRAVARWTISALLLLVALGAIVFAPTPAYADSVVVTDCSSENQLSNFILGAAGPRTITFACGTATITFSYFKTIAQDITIDGGGVITLSANNTSHFQVFSGKSFTLQNITLANGNSNSAGSIENHGTTTIANTVMTRNTTTDHGGAIYNQGSLSISNSTLSNNKATNAGGGIFNDGGAVNVNGSTFKDNKITGAIGTGGAIDDHSGNVMLTSTTFANNTSPEGGAIEIEASATATINASTLTGNSANYGGGIESFGTFTVTNSTVNNNTASVDGAGIASAGSATVRNVTLSANTGTGVSSLGGGFFQSAGNAALTFVTIAGNSAVAGAGFDNSGLGSMTLEDVLLSKNLPDDCAGTYSSLGHNLSDDSTCGNFTMTGDRKNTPAKLGPLDDNGGPTRTLMPLGGSLAIDGGQCVGGITADQRGKARPSGATCDSGSVERQPIDAPFLYLPLIRR